jgi:hypothetical protein
MDEFPNFIPRDDTFYVLDMFWAYADASLAYS